MTFSDLTRIVLVHAWVYMEGGATAATRQKVFVILQHSTDGGAAWADITGTEQIFRMRSGLVFAQIPAISRSACWCVWRSPSASTKYRIAFKTENNPGGGDDINFKNAGIFVEVFRN